MAKRRRGKMVSNLTTGGTGYVEMTGTPWWQALKLRSEIVSAGGDVDDVQMSLFQAVHGTGKARPPYADPTYYGDITYPTERLVTLLAEIAIRIGAGEDYTRARAVTRLDQGMGGGKSHACIGAFHLASNPAALRQTDLGKDVWERVKATLNRDLPDDLNNPVVVVLPCDNMTPGAPVKALDGPAVTLYERFLWRLFNGDYTLYERYQPFFNDKAKIGEALAAVNRPVLILIDEVMDYMGHGLEAAGKPDLAAGDMAFLRALLDQANDVPNVALLVVMIEHDRMALTADGEARRNELSDLLSRNGRPATVTEVGDFAAILRRRLFDTPAPTELVQATAKAFEPSLTDKAWVKEVWGPLSPSWLPTWQESVERCYPFHPMLIALAEDEWSKVTGFQRVRSTIRIFAATVYALQQCGKAGQWAPALIGPGDLPLSNNNVRENILGSGLVEDERTVANYRSLAEKEIVNGDDNDGVARRQDLTRDPLMWTEANPRAAERAATFIFLASVVGNLRPGTKRGASNPELKAVTSVPYAGYTLTDADEVIEDLINQDKGMTAVEVVPGRGHNQPTRYFLSTRLTHRMLVNNLRRTVTDEDRDKCIAEFAESLANTGPFKRLLFINADPTRTPTEVLATAGIDDARVTRLVVLDPSQFSLRNGMEADTLDALTVAMGLGTGSAKLPIEWASSAVFAVVNTQRRSLARNLAVQYLARERALQAPEIQADEDLTRTGKSELKDAKDQLEKAVRRAYQHVVYLAQPDPAGERHVDTFTFDDDNNTALDGTQVWKALASRDKVLDAGQFSAKALALHLRDQDYGRPLSEIRDAFYNAPRLPLLYGGDKDLQGAIYDAVQAGVLTMVDGNGNVVAVTAPNHVNLSSAGLRLAKPVVIIDDEPGGGQPGGGGEGPGGGEPGGGGQPGGGQPGGGQPGGGQPGGGGSGGGGDDEPTSALEKFVAFPLVGNLLDSDKSAVTASLFLALYKAFDENKASYAQGTLQLVLDAATAERIAEAAKSLGVNVTIRDQ